MSKTQDAKELARQIPGPSTVERRYVTMAIRPLRLAFVININTSPDELIRYLAYNTSIWGGIHNCLIPNDGHSLRDDWWAILQRHNPDKVVFCGEQTPKLMKKVQDNIQPYCIWPWSDKVDEEHSGGRDGMGNIPMQYVLQHIRAEQEPITKSKICIPRLPDDSPFRLCIAAHIGVTTDELTNIYSQLLGVEPLNFRDADFQSYLVGLSESENYRSPLDMTKWKLSLSHEADSLASGFHLVLCSKDNIEDICLFWNLRMSSSMISKGKALVPIDLLKGRRNLQALADWCNENVKGTNFLTLASATVNRRRLVRLRDRLKPLLAERFKIVEFLHDCFSIERFRAYETQIHEEIVLENRTFTFRKLLPSFAEYMRSGMEWVIDIDFQERGHAGNGFIPPVYPKLAHLLSGEPSNLALSLGQGYRVRLAQEQLACRVGHSTGFTGVRLPNEEQLFTSLFQSYGYKTCLTDTHRYIHGMINLLGTYREANLLKNTGIRDLLGKMQKGHAYTFTEMKGSLQPGGSSHQEAANLVADLALKGVFLRGYNIRCPACDLRRWYPISDLAEAMTCAGCLTSLQPPIEAPFHYRLNELMIRGIKEGAIPVLLTVLVFSALGNKSFMFLPSLEVQKAKEKVEIDLLAACDGCLVLAECKDLREGCSSKTVKEISEQFSGIVRIAQDIKAQLVFLSVLADTIPDDLQHYLERLRRLNKGIVIHTLLKVDLERGFVAKSDLDKKVPAGLDDLFSKPRRRRSGWVKEPGARETFF